MSGGIGGWAKVRHFATGYARNLQATRLLSAIAVAGLAVGLAGALMLALVARNALRASASSAAALAHGTRSSRNRCTAGTRLTAVPGSR